MKNICKTHFTESKQELKTSGLKVTTPRLEILDAFKHSPTPLNVKQLIKKLSSKPDIATLYRNIETLITLGLIKQINLSSREQFFELAARGHHHHLVCKNCGKLEDIQITEPTIPKAILKKHGFAQITDHTMEFFGLCANCSK